MRKHKRRTIGVAGMAGMNREQCRLTNAVAHCLTGKHGMCLDCAIKFAVAYTWGTSGKPTDAGPMCSSACSSALVEFFEETLGSKGEEVTDPAELAMLNGSVQ